MKLFEYVIIDRAGDEPVIVGAEGPKLIFAPDAGTAVKMIKEAHVDFSETDLVEIKVREF